MRKEAEMNQKRVAWEGEAYIDGVGRVRFLDPKSRELPSVGKTDNAELSGEMFYPGLAAGEGSVYGLGGQRVTVMIIEKEENNKTGLDTPIASVVY
jgi:hypothetical protein